MTNMSFDKLKTTMSFHDIQEIKIGKLYRMDSPTCWTNDLVVILADGREYSFDFYGKSRESVEIPQGKIIGEIIKELEERINEANCRLSERGLKEV